jgi:hypothetical protein
VEVELLLIEFEYACMRIIVTAIGDHDPKQDQAIMGEIDNIDVFSIGE